MNISSFRVCKFSPLRPEHMKKNKQLKVRNTSTSDTESIVSVVTRDIRALAHSAVEKMKDISDDESVFITQSFEKAKHLPNRSESNESSDSSDESSVSDMDISEAKVDKKNVTTTPKSNVTNGSSGKVSKSSSSSDSESSESESEKENIVKVGNKKTNNKPSVTRNESDTDSSVLTSSSELESESEQNRSKVTDKKQKLTTVQKVSNGTKISKGVKKEKLIVSKASKSDSDSSVLTSSSDSESEPEQEIKKTVEKKKASTSIQDKCITNIAKIDDRNKKTKQQTKKPTSSSESDSEPESNIKKTNKRPKKSLTLQENHVSSTKKNKVNNKQSKIADDFVDNSNDTSESDSATSPVISSFLKPEIRSNKPKPQQMSDSDSSSVLSSSSESDDEPDNTKQSENVLKDRGKLESDSSADSGSGSNSDSGSGSNSDSSSGSNSDSSSGSNSNSSSGSSSSSNSESDSGPTKNKLNIPQNISKTQSSLPSPRKKNAQKTPDNESSSGSSSDSESVSILTKIKSKENVKQKQSTLSSVKKTQQKTGDSESSSDGSSESESDVRSSSQKSRNSNLDTVDGVNTLRYNIPENFMISSVSKFMTKSDMKGKQLWLIRVPHNFDIGTLNNKRVQLNGMQIVSAEDETEKQYEVMSSPLLQDQMSNLCSMVAGHSEREDFHIGPEIHGQMHVMDWIPEMPPVEFTKPVPVKHSVPDNLKPTFKPFGSESPKREPVRSEEHGKLSRGKRRHKDTTEMNESVQKKKKRKRSSHNDSSTNNDDKSVSGNSTDLSDGIKIKEKKGLTNSISSVTELQKSTKKHKKHKKQKKHKK